MRQDSGFAGRSFAPYLSFSLRILWAAGEESAKRELIHALGSSDPETRILASVMPVAADDWSRKPSDRILN
jgi:hypothetical protein